MINITLKGGVIKEFEAGVTPMDIARGIGAGLFKAVCAAEINGVVCDLRTPITEDAAVSLLTFADGSIGVSETSFVSVGYPLTLEIGGTEGTLMFHDGDVHISCAETGNKWTKVEELPARLPSPLEQWAVATKPEEIPEGFGIEAACRLTRVMVLAYNAK